jgi:alcohol dehydrogenase (cytochrome c)
MPSRNRLLRFLLALCVLAVVGIVGVVSLMYAIPRYRWRIQIVRMKLAGDLPDITWTELRRLNRHGDPFNLKELVETPSPYMVIKNPYDSKEDVAAGEKLFQTNCALCHGTNGIGGIGPKLKQSRLRHGNSAWAIFKTMSSGVRGTSMPASTLPEADRWRVTAFVETLAEGEKVNIDPLLSSRISSVGPVRYEDILNAEQDTHRWLTYSGSYNAHRFSNNDQITPANVGNLRLQWMHQYTTSETQIETTPLIVDGVMFITLPPNRVEALDARTGTLIWSYDRELPQHLAICCGYVNRGLAILGNTLYLGTLDAHLIALDVKTGSVIFNERIADYKAGYSITSAPLALKNMIITGVAGGEYGIRGFITARDPKTGDEIWRFNVIPAPGETGSDSWDKNDSWKTGGGPTWLTGTFDPELNTIYWPVGNPSPNYDGDNRKGDNLFTNSVVALDADKGKLLWYFQFTPHDLYDWDATEVLVAFDKTVGGQRKRYLGQADRNAFYYVLDREKGQYLTARPIAKQNWASSIDSKGRPVLNPSITPSPEGALVYPANGGATNWMSPSYSPVTGLLYVPARDWGGLFYAKPATYREGDTFTGGFFKLTTWPVNSVIRAIDPTTGEQKWEYKQDAYTVGGVLSTKGGVVFGSTEHFFFALDANTGRELWRIDTGGTILAAPITFSLDGKQYVTIAAGHDLMTFAL